MPELCYLQEEDSPAEHDMADGVVCTRCFGAVLDDLQVAAELLRVVSTPVAGLDHVLRANVLATLRRLHYVPAGE